ncbi:MAG TPA: phosphoribosyltransferase family protein [Vicinamibacteria bacterium]|nr:phosphoribosyltransferase family protein [Vicinamibacteria bacterium]
MNFRTFRDLQARIAEWALALPDEVDLVVGLPRSGLLPATMLALHRQLPMADLDGFLAGRVYDGGRRFHARFGDGAVAAYLDEPRTVLIVDDSIRSGASLAQVRERIEGANLPHRVRYGVVYAEPGTEHLVDHYCEVVPTPRAFEWNLMHTDALLSRCCVDIDGVLCPDPTPAQNDDVEAYLDFVRSAPPLHRPTGLIGWLVTCRLEKYRAETEAWLEQRGIRYRQLIMMDYPDAAARRAAGAYGAFKAEAYTHSEALLFLESNPRQAREIAERAGRAVYCVGTRELIEPGPLARHRRDGYEWWSRLGASLRRKVRALFARPPREAPPSGGSRPAPQASPSGDAPARRSS